MKLNRREVISLVVGLVVGLLVGMVLIGSSDDMRESLFGTAGSDKKNEDVKYYLVELEQAEVWLAQQYPDNDEMFRSSVDVLARLPDLWGAQTDFEAAQKDIEVILPHTYAAIMGTQDVAELKVDQDDKQSVCLGMDDDPYQGITLYLYLTIPAERADKLDIPKEWQALKRPMTSELYWKLVACYPALENEE